MSKAIKSKAAPSVLKHATAMRKAWRTQLNTEYDRAVELARKKKLRMSHKAVRQQMVEVIPVEWASTLLGEYSGLQNSTIKVCNNGRSACTIFSFSSVAVAGTHRGIL